jgi:hypothetical protein
VEADEAAIAASVNNGSKVPPSDDDDDEWRGRRHSHCDSNPYDPSSIMSYSHGGINDPFKH